MKEDASENTNDSIKDDVLGSMQIMRIAIIASDSVTGESLAALLGQTIGAAVVACLSSLRPASAMIAAMRPDVLLLTEDFADEASQRDLRILRATTGVRTMLLHPHGEAPQGVHAAFDRCQSRWSGVAALCSALTELAHGSACRETAKLASELPPQTERAMTPREREVAALVAQGLTNLQIAASLGITEPTVKSFVGRLLRAHRCENRLQLSLKLLRPESRPERVPMREE